LQGVVAVSSEAAITEAIMRWLRSRGAHVIKTHGGPQRRGLPDLIGVFRGRALALEVKRPGGRPTRLQEYELGRWAAAGAAAAIVTSVDDVKRLIEEVIGGEQVREVRSDARKAARGGARSPGA